LGRLNEYVEDIFKFIGGDPMKIINAILFCTLLIANAAWAQNAAPVCGKAPDANDTPESISLLTIKQNAAGCFDAEAKQIFDNVQDAAKKALLPKKEIKKSDVTIEYFQQALEQAKITGDSDNRSYKIIAKGYQKAIAALKGTPGADDRNLNRDSWKMSFDPSSDNDEIPAFGFRSAQGLNIQKEATDCTADLTCVDVYRHLNDLALYALVGHLIISDYHMETINKVAADLEIRSTEWNSYFDGAVGQYPWELLANSYFYKKNWLGVNAQSQEGFGDSPTRQIIAIHPGIGLDYIDDAPDGSQFKPALVMEWIGLNGWDYDQKGHLVYPYYISGISLISTYADRKDVDDFRFGALVRIKSAYAIGITTDSDNNVGVIVNIDFGNWWSKEAKPFIDSYLK
jgi:hypothetical protein